MPSLNEAFKIITRSIISSIKHETIFLLGEVIDPSELAVKIANRENYSKLL